MMRYPKSILFTALLCLAAARGIAAEAPAGIPLATLTAIPPVSLEGESHHVQGIETDGDSLWVTSVDKPTSKAFLAKFDAKTGKRIAEVEVQQGELFHPGGLQLRGKVLWVPVAAYRREGPSRIESRDPATLALISSFDCADHIGCVAVDGKRLIGGNWDCRKLYFWDLNGKQLEVKDNPTPATYQELKLVDGALVASGTLGKGKARIGVVDWLDPATLASARRITGAMTDRGVCFMQEGMALRGGKLLLLPEDGASRVFAFKLPKP